MADFDFFVGVTMVRALPHSEVWRGERALCVAVSFIVPPGGTRGFTKAQRSPAVKRLEGERKRAPIQSQFRRTSWVPSFTQNAAAPSKRPPQVGQILPRKGTKEGACATPAATAGTSVSPSCEHTFTPG